ncbi:MAG: hypothetical protein FJ295_12130 [Planctomycetes bacterium]|nr:hypothetical protein [Planctomycetota bacterium]
MMRFDDLFGKLIDLAVRLCAEAQADALLIMLPGPTDWERLREHCDRYKVIVSAESAEHLAGAAEAGLEALALEQSDVPVAEKMTQALLLGVAREMLQPGAGVVAVYSGFEDDVVDSLSFIWLDEHLGRLTARDLQKLGTSVPLETLKTVVDVAVEIGREGREGKPVGTMFVVGDTRRVLQHVHPAGFDPVKGYGRKDRSLHDSRVREAIKEIAPLDGAFIISSDGTVEKACQLIDATHASLTLSRGLGSRHWAAAAISKVTSAVAVVVSESNGTVRIFQNGEVVLRVEPFRRAMKWKGFDSDLPSTSTAE